MPSLQISKFLSTTTVAYCCCLFDNEGGEGSLVYIIPQQMSVKSNFSIYFMHYLDRAVSLSFWPTVGHKMMNLLYKLIEVLRTICTISS